MTDEDIVQIERRENAATPGPWFPQNHTTGPGGGIVSFATHVGDFHHRENAAFIAAARTDVPALVAEVRRLREEYRKEEEFANRATADRDSARAEVERLKAAIRIVHEQVDQTDPRCPVGVALTIAGLERKP